MRRYNNRNRTATIKLVLLNYNKTCIYYFEAEFDVIIHQSLQAMLVSDKNN